MRKHTTVYGYVDSTGGTFPKPVKMVQVINACQDYGVSSFTMTPRQARLVAAAMIRAADAIMTAEKSQNFQSAKIR